MRNHTYCAARILSSRRDRFDVHSEHIPFRRAVNHDWTALRIEKRGAEFMSREISFGPDLALKSVDRLDNNAVTRLNLQDGIGIRPNGILKLALTFLSKLVRLFDFSARDTPTVHD